jgi:hypothetical protein
MAMPQNGDTIVECAQCARTGKNRVDAGLGEVGGFVCLGGMLLPSGRIRAICAPCVRAAVSAFARGANLKPLGKAGA